MNTSINRSLMNFGRSLVLMLSAGSGLGMSVTHTARASEEPSVAVSYQDLDLSRSADARLLYARLQRAAGSVCQPMPEAKDLARHAVWEQCYRVALERAVKQINAPQVLALYRADSSTAVRG